MIAELFSPSTRALAAGIATAITFGAGGLCDETYLTLRDHIGYEGIFILYSSVCAAGGVAVLFLLPETKGKTLEEVQALIARQRCCSCRVLIGSEAHRPSTAYGGGGGDDEPPPLVVKTSSAFILAAWS